MRKPQPPLETGRPPNWPFRDHYDAAGKLHRSKTPQRMTREKKNQQLAQQVGLAPF